VLGRGVIIYCLWASTTQRCWTVCVFLQPRHGWCGRVMLLISMFGGGCGLRVLADDPGGRRGGGGGHLAGCCGPCERVGMGKGKRGPSGQSYHSFLELGAWTTPCPSSGKPGGWKWYCGGPRGAFLCLPTFRDPRLPTRPKMRPFRQSGWLAGSLADNVSPIPS
jgi:hypothetical protein